jgi:hypothetical protein
MNSNQLDLLKEYIDAAIADAVEKFEPGADGYYGSNASSVIKTEAWERFANSFGEL